MDVVEGRPVRPGFHVLAKLHVHEAVGERGGHCCGDRRVLHAVAGGADVPAVGDLVEIAEPAVKDQFVCGDLQGAVGGGQFVEEENAASLPWPFAGDHPVDFLVLAVGNGKTADVHGLPLGEAHVNELDAHFVCNASDDGGLAEARCSPDHQRREDFRQFGVLRQSLELHPEDLLQLGGGNAVVHVNEVVCFFYHFSVPYGV